MSNLLNMANNGFQGSYANDRPPSSLTSAGSGDAADVVNDPASSGFFANDLKKHEDLKTMLDSNKDSHKLEAMKRIIGMVAKGKDVSDLFPPIVKNVVSKNTEVKKLVYVYLVRYAEEQQDLALLSISTFQRALKDPNQLIRASALRILSSIRVPMIVPIMMLAIKEAVMDMSPYVRKTAAHAIPKLYSLDPEQKEQLIEVIEKLLADKTTLVAGSAIQAFEEVCPDRIDLIHKNYRKLCNLLVDVEEWGQVVIINMLTRYTRTQFIDPNCGDETAEGVNSKFYESSGDSSNEGEQQATAAKNYVMDPDHRLLLRNAKPLLNSRNAAVVMAVAQLYHHCSPKTEVSLVAKPLVRLLRSHKEVQYIVLSNIASMSVKRKGMFEPFLKSFYVRSTDPLQSKLLKLEILTNLGTETNISTILREFQTYVTSADKEFAAATIQAIGRCASNIAEITDACLNGLLYLLSNRDSVVVGESVIVIKKLLQMQPSEHKDIIVHLAKLADTITVPMARASILWLIGEYSDRVPKIAPDVLRKMAKGFADEEDIVKLQILNLAAKLCITNSRQTKLLCQYVFNLAKYDQNYDIRDRARFLRQLILPAENGGTLAKHAKRIFLASKPAPVLESKFKDRESFQLGTLSHVINMKAYGYQEIPDWPENAPDPKVRNVEVVMPWVETKPRQQSKTDKKRSFYTDSESSAADNSSGETSSADSSDEDSDSSTVSDSSAGNTSASETHAPKVVKKHAAPAARKPSKASSEEESTEDDSSETDSDSSADISDDSQDSKEKVKEPVKPKKSVKEVKETKYSENLLDLDDFSTPSNTMPALDILTPTAPAAKAAEKYSPIPNFSHVSGTQYNPEPVELLNKIAGHGLAVAYKFTRTVSIFSPKVISVELTFTNHTEKPLKSISMGDKKTKGGIAIHDFPEVVQLDAGKSSSVLMAIDFNDTTQPAQFDILTHTRLPVSINAPVGELLKPNTLSESDFKVLQGKLTGMNENIGKVDIPAEMNNAQSICSRVYEAANTLSINSKEAGIYRFASKTVSHGVDLLITIKITDNKATLIVNCEKMVIGSMLVKDIKSKLSK